MDTSPMPGECSVAGCKGRDDLHSFPESEREKRSWSDFCKRDIVNFETARVCGRHFRDSDYEAMASPPKKLKKGSQPTQQPPGMKGKPATEKCSIEEFQRQLKRLKKEKNILLKRNRLWAKEMKEARRQMSDLRYHNELMAEERDKARKERDALQLEKRHLLKALDEERKEKEALVARKKQEGAELHEAVTESSEIPDCPSMETPTVNVIIVKKENEISHTQNHNEEMKDVESEDTDIEPKNEEEITIKEEEVECNDPLLTFPCKFCETVYTTKYDLENHIKEVHERGDLLSCCSCEKMFHKDIELKLHEVVQHQAKLCKKEIYKMQPVQFYGGPGSAEEREDSPQEESDDELYETESSCSSDSLSTDAISENENVTEEEEEEEDSVNDVVASSVCSWKAVASTQRSFPFTVEEELCVRPSSSVDGKIWPVDAYLLFLTDDLVDLMVTETNRYADQLIASRVLTRKSRLRAWVPTTSAEIKKFLGLILHMGVNVLPETSLYWSKSVLYENNLVPLTMERDRFQLLLRMFHFADNSLPHTGRFYKVKPLFDKIVQRFQEVYKPGEEVVIDETMVPFRGRIFFRQYIPGKRHKYGLKLYKLCTTEAYTLNLELYCGVSEKYQSLGKTESVVARLMLPLLEKGVTLYTDNFYTSKPLADYLLSHKTYLCGTVRAFRKGLPKEVTKAKIKKGEVASLENDEGIKVFNWKDKRNVFILSTVPEHDDKLIATGKLSRNGEEIKKPKCVMDYNKAKKGVDLSDQLSSYYTALRKNRKWYKKVALELVTGSCVVNAFIIFNKYLSDKKWTLLQFKESIILSLLTDSPFEKIRPGRKLSYKVSPSGPQHFLSEAEGSKRESRKRCVGCYEMISTNEGSKVASKRAKKISTFCSSCDGKPYLCLSCFETKHSK